MLDWFVFFLGFSFFFFLKFFHVELVELCMFVLLCRVAFQEYGDSDEVISALTQFVGGTILEIQAIFFC